MKINVVEVPYEEWIKNPFPQPVPFKIDEITRFKIIGCPPEYAESLRANGVEVDTPPPKTVSFIFTTKPQD